MKKIFTQFVLAALFFNMGIFAQTETEPVGKIVQQDDAVTLFGEVIQQIEIQASVVDSLCKLGDDFISFAIIDSHAVIFSGVKPTMAFDGVIINNDKVTNRYSKSVVLELLGSDPTGTLLLQIRTNKFTIQYKDRVMEFSQPCPPFCK